MPIDYKEYPVNWPEIRERILKRASHKCEECGLPNYSVIKRTLNGKFRFICGVEWDMVHSRIKYSRSNMTESLKYHGFTKIILTIAHLDHDIENNADENLKALCQKCHLTHDRHRHKITRLYGRRKNQLALEIPNG